MEGLKFYVSLCGCEGKGWVFEIWGVKMVEEIVY